MTEEIQKAVAYKLEQVVDSNDVQLISHVLWHDYLPKDAAAMSELFKDNTRNLGLCGSRVWVSNIKFIGDSSGKIIGKKADVEFDFIFSNANAGETGFEGTAEQQFLTICGGVMTEFIEPQNINPHDVLGSGLSSNSVEVGSLDSAQFSKFNKFMDGKAVFMMTCKLKAIQSV